MDLRPKAEPANNLQESGLGIMLFHAPNYCACSFTGRRLSDGSRYVSNSRAGLAPALDPRRRGTDDVVCGQHLLDLHGSTNSFNPDLPGCSLATWCHRGIAMSLAIGAFQERPFIVYWGQSFAWPFKVRSAAQYPPAICRAIVTCGCYR